MSANTITKSIRLTPEESREISVLSNRSAVTEAALMKKWVLEGMQAQKLELAIQAYMQRRTDLRGGAAIADVSYNRFMQEVQARNIVILDDDRLADRLAYLVEVYSGAPLDAAAQR